MSYPSDDENRPGNNGENDVPEFLSDEVFGQVLEQALSVVQEKTQPPGNRLDAIRFIIDQFESKFFPILEGILNDETEHPDVRSAAALALGKVGGDGALNALMAHVDSHDVTVKNYSLQALGILGREEGIPPLLEALEDGNNTIFASAAQALGEIGKPAVPHLIHLLDPKEADVRDDARCVAAWQLGKMKYAEAIPALLKSIATLENIEVKALSIWALGEIGVATAEVLETLKRAKVDPDNAISERATMAMHKITRYLN
ncbi:MAG: HEAT repeat domain-containing protein [Vampirovibrionales bacterium]|nr:HEAT repeat domain-containing protein [Vampirovibrionales bacterium]